MKTTLFLLLFTLSTLAGEFARIDRETMTVLTIKRADVPADRLAEYFATSADDSPTFWVPVVREAPPAHDAATEKLVQVVTPALDALTISYAATPQTAEELANTQYEARLEALRTELKALRTKLNTASATNAEAQRAVTLIINYLRLQE